ncbi:MAG TPA: hypothetical protein VLC98_17995 [Phnomibacter sp.]|nr:hypothetical protein [Phnomibacter sp.]
MRVNYRHLTIAACMVVVGLPFGATAQKAKKENTDSASTHFSYGRPDFWRAYDASGINVFETTKDDYNKPYTGMKIRFGSAFTQQYQDLKHENPDAAFNQTTNKLFPINNGFMTAQASLFLDAQLADGIRLNVATYLSSRHHNEAWVKGGYIQFDKLPFKGKIFDDIMKVTTIKIGEYDVNYGDQHFRRSDGGHVMYNAFMDNYIMDAFTTEIGGDITVQHNGFFGTFGLTGGVLKGYIDSVVSTSTNPEGQMQPSIILKAGIDKQITEDLRLRGSASWYHNGNTGNKWNTLYWGDRTGSNYNNVMEKWKGADGVTPQAYTAIPWSGRLNPGFSQKVDAVMLNGFAKYKGFEVFGTYETASGCSGAAYTGANAKFTDSARRTMNQFAIEGIYRLSLGNPENVFIGARYNTVSGKLASSPTIIYTDDITVNRLAFSAGFFMTKNILLKAEYVKQQYKNFPTTDYRAGGKFDGYVIEAAISF